MALRVQYVLPENAAMYTPLQNFASLSAAGAANKVWCIPFYLCNSIVVSIVHDVNQLLPLRATVESK
ncbi:hypothetical protein [Paenibacillus alvei]|uniref:Uncharacterized protein n=1 Tax=Paenibacillus alvei TaxID=44250 RepID=A0AAP7A3H3_PAEAL|nr:hypothetical protein [Paenibacillus alvei]MCY9579646.1 hypothetical protein [Paenibacillus alvei]MCY9586300.1 hypothetical protein [Paenibacillus alvei]NEZ44898.1 hypothetical protein [Paenibacillus alvei]NOJ73137.1 hypothetical protein [Paenibacillus alvei]